MLDRRPESRRWPPLGAISFYDDDPDETPPFLVWEDREPDLFDLLMLDWDPDERTVFLCLSTDSRQWKVWTTRR
jgi:hypothetical protein